MPKTKTVNVPHLGGIEASYQAPNGIDPGKPTLILVNSFTTSSELYRSQYGNKKLADAMNLVAIELLGHGQTRAKVDNWTYWDTAIMNVQVMEALGIEKAFVLGTSQGGWITVRMALIAPGKIVGIIPLGTSMDYESAASHELGCWDAPTVLTPAIDAYKTSSPTPDFEPNPEASHFLIDIGFGKDCAQEVRDFWVEEIRKNYQGDDGRRRVLMATINLRDRDGLRGRLHDVKCPVLWLHGTADPVYSVANAGIEIKMFVNSPDARLKTVEGGQHFLSASHPEVVDQELLDFVGKYGKSSSKT